MRAYTKLASLSFAARYIKRAVREMSRSIDVDTAPCMQKYAISHRFSRAHRRIQKFKCEHAPQTVCQKVKAWFSVGDGRRVRGFKMRARTQEAVLSKMLQSVKLADPQTTTPPPCMQKYAISHVTPGALDRARKGEHMWEEGCREEACGFEFDPHSLLFPVMLSPTSSTPSP